MEDLDLLLDGELHLSGMMPDHVSWQTPQNLAISNLQQARQNDKALTSHGFVARSTPAMSNQQ